MTTATAPPTPGLAVPSPFGGSDDARRASLRRMKLLALGLFGLAALIYVVTLVIDGPHASGLLGYVQTGSEAAMVGALADWFAVTALFRHPLGLPIPHTALIPTKKDQLGDTLGEFVGTHFLTDEVVRAKVSEAEVTRRAGEWLAQPDNAERVAGELGRAVRGLLAVLDEEQMRTSIEKVITERVERTEVSPALGLLLGHIVADHAHSGIVDVLAERTHNWVAENRQTIMAALAKQAPSWSPRFVDTIVTDRVHFELVRFAAAVRDDPDHPVRQAIDRMLTQLAEDLRTNPDTRARVEAGEDRGLPPPGRPGVGVADLGDRAAGPARSCRRSHQPAADPGRPAPSRSWARHWPPTARCRRAWTAGSPTPRWPWSATTR